MAQVEITPQFEKVLHRFADEMGMSWEEAATYLLTRSIADLLATPGWTDLRHPIRNSRGL